MQMRTAGIVGTGLYVPEKIITNDWFKDFDLPFVTKSDAPKKVSANDWFKEIDLLSMDEIFAEVGVQERRFCAKGESASDMEVKALLAAVENAGISIDDIEMILDGPSLHDELMPGNAAALQYKSGAKNAASMNVETACTSLISQISVAWGMIASGGYNTVACVVSANWTKVADYTEKNSLFVGDGAAAIIMQPVTPGKGVLSVHLETDGKCCGGAGINFRLPNAYIRNYRAADYLEPARERFYFYFDRQHAGFEEMKRSVLTKTPEVALKALAKAGYTKDHIDFLITHNPNKVLTELWRKALGVPPEKTYLTIEKYGNMSAASIGANLHEASVNGMFKDGDIVVLCAPGVGCHYAAAVLKWGK